MSQNKKQQSKKTTILSSRDEAIRELWKKGIIYWKLSKVQKEMYNAYKTMTGKTTVFTASRRIGKSFALCTISSEHAMQNPGSIIKYVLPEKGWAKKVIKPLMIQIFKDCPEELRPEWSTQDQEWQFPNGSVIQVAGADLGGADSLRGSNCSLSIIDEAGFCDDLTYIVQSVLLPSMLTTHGKLVMASTPPVSNDHPFVDYAHKNQSHRTFTIWDNDMLTHEQKLEMMDEYGGESSPAWKREFLCEFVTDASRAVVPEFEEVKKKIIFQEYQRPAFYHIYASADFGWAKDLTVVLFAYYDFDSQKLIIEDEWTAIGAEATSANIAEAIKRKEGELWTNPLTNEQQQVQGRFSDVDYRIIYDLSSQHNLTLIPTQKFDKDSALSNVRTKIRNEKILINQRCVNLLKHLEYGIWNKSRTSFQRSEGLGHLDCIDALIYLVRNVDWNRNPYPPGYEFRGQNMENKFVPARYYENKQSAVAKWATKLFTKKTSIK